MHNVRNRRSLLTILLLCILFPLLTAPAAYAATDKPTRVLGAIWSLPDYNAGHTGALAERIVVYDEGDCDTAGYLTPIDETQLDDLHLSMKHNTRSISNYRLSPNCNYVKVYKWGFWWWSDDVICYKGWLNVRDTGSNCNGEAKKIRWQHGNG